MFDGWHLVLIFVVALVVLGPTKMPGLVRTIGRWVGKARSMARDFQQQLENEATLAELNRATDLRASKESVATSPAPPPEFSGDPVTSTSAASETSAEPGPYAGTEYPYGALMNSEPAAQEQPKPGDDTYSHAHGSGTAAGDENQSKPAA